MLVRGELISFDSSNWTATVRLWTSAAVVLTGVPVAHHLPPALLVANAQVGLLVLDPTNPADAILAVVYTATPPAFVSNLWKAIGMDTERFNRYAPPASPHAYDLEFASAVNPFLPSAPWYIVKAGTYTNFDTTTRKGWLDTRFFNQNSEHVLGLLAPTVLPNTLRVVAHYWPSINSAAHEGFEFRGYNRRCPTSGSFKINGSVSGTTVPYDNGAGGNPTGESNLYANMVLFNLTQGKMAVIQAVDTGANTITVTASADVSGWADNDDLATGNWVGWQLHSDGAGGLELRARKQINGVLTNLATLAGQPYNCFLALFALGGIGVRFQWGNADTPGTTVLYTEPDTQFVSAFRYVTLHWYGSATTVEEYYVDYVRLG
jgi:hypothetical protein